MSQADSYRDEIATCHSDEDDDRDAEVVIPPLGDVDGINTVSHNGGCSD